MNDQMAWHAMMRRTVISSLIASILALAIPACNATKKQEVSEAPSNANDKVQNLIDDHIRACWAAWESDGYWKTNYQAFLPRFTELTNAHLGTDAEVRATLWLIENSPYVEKEAQERAKSRAFDLANDLIERHPNSLRLGGLAGMYSCFKPKDAESLYRRLLDVSPHREVHGAANYGLARLIDSRDETGEPNEYYKKLLGTYSDVPYDGTTLGVLADARLNQHTREQLSVGELAPEIVGIDQEGAPMKLSEFRGNVVLLYFWAHW